MNHASLIIFVIEYLPFERKIQSICIHTNFKSKYNFGNGPLNIAFSFLNHIHDLQGFLLIN
jgi:hypothetical protein